ncbi:MAG: hypothetical protein WDN06_18260 [Asticcacaulis sp.]
MRACVLALAILSVASSAPAADFKVGDRVQAWAIAWYNATITEIGTGDHAGQYKVHFDDGRDDAYLPATSLRAPPNLAMAMLAASAAGGPAVGTYACDGVDDLAGQHMSLQLNNGQYRDPSTYQTPGAYSYSTTYRQITFTSGSHDDLIGDVSTGADGHTHIALWRRDDDGIAPGVTMTAITNASWPEQTP